MTASAVVIGVVPVIVGVAGVPRCNRCRGRATVLRRLSSDLWPLSLSLVA
jgi:hypothetical protein